MFNTKKYLFTKEGFASLEEELDKLIKRRPQVVINLTNAREQGDLSENAGYHAAKEELGQIDSRVKEIKYLLRLGKIQESGQVEQISFGNTVTVHNGEEELTFTVVEEFEADPANAKISTSSPIGRALINRKMGESVEVETPNGKIVLKILKIS